MITHRRLFYINSAKRQSGTDGNFNTIVKIPPEEKFTHVCVMEANIPKSYYLVQDGFNTFNLIENGISIIVTLTPGNYNVNSWCKYLDVTLTTISPNGWVYNCAYPTGLYGPQTAKFTYAVTGNGMLQPSFQFGSFLYEQMGFPANSTVTFVGSTIISTNVVKFQLEDALFIHSDMVGDGDQDILQQIYTNGVPDFGYINYKCLVPEAMVKKLSSTGGNSFRFTLTDENGSQIDLNGQNYNMVICVCHMTYPLMIDQKNQVAQEEVKE